MQKHSGALNEGAREDNGNDIGSIHQQVYI